MTSRIGRVLIVKTSSLGDVVHMLPAVTDIAQAFPGVVIDWVIEAPFAEIPEMHRAVRRSIPVALRRWRRTPFSPATWGEARATVHDLRAEAYDAVLDTQGLLKSAVLAWLARGRALGPDRSTAREPMAGLLYRRGVPMDYDRHAVIRYREFSARALGYAMPGGPADFGLAPAIVRGEAPTAVLLHGTARREKEWPEACWTTLIEGLRERGMRPLLPWGNERERHRAERLAADFGGVLPRSSLSELSGILSRAAVVIGVDSGLTHLAGALKTPTVGLYTDTNPALFGVYADPGAHVRNLGGNGRAPSPDEVLAAIVEMGVRPMS